MASLKKLAGQTMWYGVSSIAARMLTYLLTPYLTYTLKSTDGQVVFGQNTFIYSLFPVMNVLYTYGMETAFFRFSNTEDKGRLYRTQMTAMVLSTLMLSLVLFVFREPLAGYTELNSTQYVGWCSIILALDAMSALPYAMLRKENRPRKYALTKVAGILVYVFTIVFLFTFGDDIVDGDNNSWFASFYHKHWGIGFILFANVLQAAATLLLLFKELSMFRFQIDGSILKKVLLYGWPILLAGFAGQINDNVNRFMFMNFYEGTKADALRETGFYGAAVRLSILIQLGVQAFKMAAEPFFFSIAKDKDAKPTYARVMKWFVVILAVMFLNVTLFIDIWKYFVSAPYRQSLGLVPILLAANIFIGIYYNLTIWYKLTDKTSYGAYIMLIGASVTIIFNWFLIPFWGYTAAAWGTLLSNGAMMYLSYTWGQKFYPIPYEISKMAKYLGMMLVIYAAHAITGIYMSSSIAHIVLGASFFVLYLYYILKQEREELQKFPVIGRFVK